MHQPLINWSVSAILNYSATLDLSTILYYALWFNSLILNCLIMSKPTAKILCFMNHWRWTTQPLFEYTWLTSFHRYCTGDPYQDHLSAKLHIVKSAKSSAIQYNTTTALRIAVPSITVYSINTYTVMYRSRQHSNLNNDERARHYSITTPMPRSIQSRDTS